jgi:GT2 family glycosyltransferase
MALVGANDWVCFLDHDMMFTTPRWHDQLEDAIVTQPCGSFTAKTNRIYSEWQKVGGLAAESDNLRNHRALGSACDRRLDIMDVTEREPGWGGVLMLISKAAWLDAGGFADGMMCVDHQMHYALRRAGRRIYCISGLYVYHYRGTSRRGDVSKFPKAKSPRTGKPCTHRYEP